MVYAQSNSVRNNAEVQRNLHKVSVRAKRQQQRVESIKTIGNYEIDFLISEFIWFAFFFQLKQEVHINFKSY